MKTELIIALIQAAIALIEKIPGVVSALRQNAELSPEEETELDEKIADLKNKAHWILS